MSIVNGELRLENTNDSSSNQVRYCKDIESAKEAPIELPPRYITRILLGLYAEQNMDAEPIIYIENGITVEVPNGFDENTEWTWIRYFKDGEQYEGWAQTNRIYVLE